MADPIDLSAYNITNEWKRIESPFRRLLQDPEGIIFASIAFPIFSLPLNLFLIIQVLR